MTSMYFESLMIFRKKGEDTWHCESSQVDLKGDVIRKWIDEPGEKIRMKFTNMGGSKRFYIAYSLDDSRMYESFWRMFWNSKWIRLGRTMTMWLGATGRPREIYVQAENK